MNDIITISPTEERELRLRVHHLPSHVSTKRDLEDLVALLDAAHVELKELVDADVERLTEENNDLREQVESLEARLR